MKHRSSLKKLSCCIGLLLSPSFLMARQNVEKPTEIVGSPEKSEADKNFPAQMEQQTAEIKLMQEIEPNFVPKDERAIQLFMLQKAAGENEKAIKDKKELALKVRMLFSKKFRDNLQSYGEQKLGDTDIKFQHALNDSIQSYEQALKYHPHSARVQDALYFLGLSYFEVDEKSYFEKLAAYSAAREQGRKDVEYPEENFSRTISVYERLLKEYPDFRFMDSVYYLLGLALWYEGDFYQASDRFQELIARFPKSKYVDEVWFRLGEYFYDLDEYDDALNAYARVLKNTQSLLYEKAVYKSAWAYFQSNRYDQAIAQFSKIVELNKNNRLASIRAEAIRYIVKSFSEKMYAEGSLKISKQKNVQAKAEREFAEREGLKLAKRVISYYGGLSKPPEYFRDILVELASQLLDESKSDGAILALRTIIDLNTNDKDNPRLAIQIVDILNDAHRYQEARSENEALIQRYGKGSVWYNAMADNIEAQRFSREAVRDAMLSLAVYHHRQGKELKKSNPEKSRENFKQAAILYARYIEQYPERDDTHKALFYFAESMAEAEGFRLALDAYRLLINYPLPMPENYRRDAIYNIVFTYRHVLQSEALEKRFKSIDFDALTSKQRGEKKEEIPEVGLEYLAAIDEFLKLAPDDPQVPVFLFHAAALYYVYGHDDEALSRFAFIIDSYPQSKAASVAARLVLDDAIAKNEWSRVIELSRHFKEQKLGGSEKEFTRIEKNAQFKIARSVFEEAHELQKNNQLTESKAKYRESAQLFATLLKEDPNNPYADIMLFNSARAVTESGVITEALPLYRELYSKYPKSQYAKSARFQEAFALEKMLKFDEAARAYDGIVKADPQSEAAGDAMLNKALLFEAAGNLKNATAAFVAFAKKYPARSEAPDALLSAALMYKKQGDIKQQITILSQFIKQYEKQNDKIPAIIEAHAQIGDSYGDLIVKTKSPVERTRYQNLQKTHYQSCVKLYSDKLQSPIAAHFASQAQLFLEKPEQDAFKRLSINARSGKAQASQLTGMMKKLTQLTAKNEAIIKKYAQPLSNAESLYRVGALYEHLAKSMLKAPCPRDVAVIDDFACDEYIVLLEDRAVILEDKAVSADAQAYEIALEAYDAPSQMINKIQVALNRLKPGKYPRIGDVIEKPVWGEIIGKGRMLSTGRMAFELHQAEKDPDVEKAVEIPQPQNNEEKVEEISPVTQETVKEENAE
ncbi:MAG: tetratricopeptide repeat protein [Myxococcales bacterium]|nr:tetratricopeptide repeat protein [Myxococcales bacterium]USN50213.1 MAG: tetratricopeptide repeat protein [Myxococcales bacterium]